MSGWSKWLLACGLAFAGCVQPAERAEDVAALGLTAASSSAGESCDPENARGVATRLERALLDTIAFTEGTRGHGQDGYNVTFGYHYFGSCEAHPNLKVCSGSLCSTAAGRYQFLYKTYLGLQLPSFWPEEQERGALELIVRRGVSLPSAPLTATEFANALDRLSYEWASLPPGRYGQTQRTQSEIRSEYCRLAGCGPRSGAAPGYEFLAVASDGLLYRYARNAAHELAGSAISSGWETVTAMGAGADYDEDGQADFIAVDDEYGLELYAADGNGDFWYRPLALDGAAVVMVGAGADYDADDHADFLAVDDAGELLLLRGDGRGNFERRALGSWAGDVAAIGGGADYSGDGQPDFIELREDASSWLYLGDGTGRFSPRRLQLEGPALRLLGGAADFSGDGRADLFAIAGDGDASLYVGQGNNEFDQTRLGPGWDRIRFLN